MAPPRRRLLVPALLLGLASPAAADPPGGLVSVGASVKTDRRNPLAGNLPLYQGALGVGIGRALGGGVAVEARGSLALATSDGEGAGRVVELGVAGRWLPFRAGAVRAGGGLGLGWTRTGYEDKELRVTTDGLHVEPSLQAEYALAPRVWVGLSLLARTERLLGDQRVVAPDGTRSSQPVGAPFTPQYGAGVALDLRIGL